MNNEYGIAFKRLLNDQQFKLKEIKRITKKLTAYLAYCQKKPKKNSMLMSCFAIKYLEAEKVFCEKANQQFIDNPNEKTKKKLLKKRKEFLEIMKLFF